MDFTILAVVLWIEIISQSIYLKDCVVCFGGRPFPAARRKFF